MIQIHMRFTPMSRDLLIVQKQGRVCKKTSFALALGLMLSVLVGCGNQDGPQRYRVSGSVSFDGKPVPFGNITFDPDSSAGNSGPQSAATIVDGKYDTQVENGIVGGPHIVRITGNDRVPTSIQPNSEPLFGTYEVKETFEKQNGTKDFSVPRDDKKSRSSSLPVRPAKPLRTEEQP